MITLAGHDSYNVAKNRAEQLPTRMNSYRQLRQWLTLAQTALLLWSIGVYLSAPHAAPELLVLLIPAGALTLITGLSTFGHGALSGQAGQIMRWLCGGYTRARLLITGVLCAALISLVFISRAPNGGWYLSFPLLFPWLAIGTSLMATDPQVHRALPYFGKIMAGILGTLISLLLLELLLQIVFPRLPQAITAPMPQAALRSGVRYNEAVGVHQYPSGPVQVAINGFNGDQYYAVCPASAQGEPTSTAMFTRDTFGFRNPEPWPDRVAIVVVGDSFTAGEAVQHPYWDALGPSLLELGLPGSGSLEQLKLLQAYGFSRHPRVVIMAYFEGNDISDTWEYVSVQRQGRRKYVDNTYRRTPLEFSVTYNILTWLLNKMTDRVDPCADMLKDTPGRNLLLGSYHMHLLSIPRDELRSSAIWGHTRDAVVIAAEQTSAIDASFVVLYVPDKFSAYWNVLERSGQLKRAVRDIHPLKTTDDGDGLEARLDYLSTEQIAETFRVNRNAHRELLAELATEYKFYFLDLTPAFQAATEAGEQLYFYSDGHWNQAGHDVARRVLQEFLAEHHLLSPG